jgi:hypothetical protein
VKHRRPTFARMERGAPISAISLTGCRGGLLTPSFWSRRLSQTIGNSLKTNQGFPLVVLDLVHPRWAAAPPWPAWVDRAR